MQLVPVHLDPALGTTMGNGAAQAAPFFHCLPDFLRRLVARGVIGRMSGARPRHFSDGAGSRQ
ncbi:hypothetical protein SAMN05444415_106147 [Salipiger profundus]|nr:hypothetical protein SAMN05444415_106147 [Salipiger profundus]